MKREIKKPSCFERNVLSMILHELSGAQTAKTTPTPATSYASWNTDCYNWCDMEQHLFAPPDAPAEEKIQEVDDDQSTSGCDALE
jgi:hypothetical protein